MRVRVLSFAGVREILGAGELALELPAGAGIAELRSALEREYPALERYWDRLAVAVDGRLGDDAARLRDGSEVALLPPVSGGAEAPELLTEGPIDVASVSGRVASRGRGAVLAFEGRVRDRHDGREVTHLVYDAYRPMAETSLRRIIDEIEAESGELSVAIVHRLGRVPAGEASVVIAVASPHREAAYRASREALERLKREVPIWKNEHYADGSSRWREEEPLARAPAANDPGC
jgi:molybdopterin synthase catalytic subunit